jgi:para-nitrobenzyl esterase
MIRTALIVALAAAALPASAIAADPAKPEATAPAAKPKYTTAETDIGTLLDDPAAKAIIDKYIPGMTSNEQIEMARSMTLKTIQTYAPDDVTDARLAQIDADLAKLK